MDNSNINFDICLNSIPDECMRAYLEKETRFDNRKFYQSRQFDYNYKVLNSFEYSAIGSMGLNKILLVLKEGGKNSDEQPKINIIIDNFENNKSTKKIYDFIDKILKNNISYSNNELEKKEYNLFITIQSIDGNIYEVIAKSLDKFLSRENNIGIVFNKKYISKTICFINGTILFDPIKQETELADFICNIIKFGEKFILYKIGGNVVPLKLLQQAILQIDNNGNDN